MAPTPEAPTPEGTYPGGTYPGGVLAYFTCDAGPQTKVLTSTKDAPRVIDSLKRLPGIVDIIECRLGGGVTVL